MAKTSINPEKEVTSTEQYAPTNENTAVAHYDPDQYDDASRDVQDPTLSLIGKMGPASKAFPKNVGEFCLDKILLGESAEVIAIGFLKFFSEKYRKGVELKYGMKVEPMPKRWLTAAEAAKDGYTVAFENKPFNKATEAARVAWLVKGPKDDKSGEFYLTAPDGNQYAIARSSYMSRGSFDGVYVPVYSHAYRLSRASGGKLKPEETQFYNMSWKMTAEHKEKGDQDWYEARLNRTAALSPEMVAWVESEVGKYKITQ